MRNAQLSNGTVFWRHWLGELMVAPDSRMKPFPGWNRIECKTVAEVEQYSRQMAHQEFRKMRDLTVDAHLKGQKRRDQIKANCKLRLASGCISAEDERLTRQTLQSLERKDNLLYKIITDEPDLSRCSLVIEQKEESTSPLAGLEKRRGLADHEVNQVGKLVGA